MMTPDALLNILGIVLSVIGLFADQLFANQRNQRLLIIVTACSVICLFGYSIWLKHDYNNEITQTEIEIKRRLTNNRWTAEQLLNAMSKPDYKVFHEALSRAVASGAIHDQPTSCLESTVNGGAELDTRVYFQ